MLYPVTITDTCSRTILLQAKTPSEALERAEELNMAGEVDVGYEFYIGSSYDIEEDYEPCGEAEMTGVFRGVPWEYGTNTKC